MKLLPLTVLSTLIFAIACGSSSNTSTPRLAGTPVLTPVLTRGLTPVPTTRLGTPRPGATPRVAATPCPLPAALTGPIPAVPAGTGDVQTTPSGLQYQDITLGAGDQPQAGQSVTVNYTGWLDDGTKFDSSLDRCQPFAFALGKGQVIKGWDEGLATMKIGGKRRLIIPASLGYGTSANGKIPPNSRLTFDVELISAK